MRTGSSLLHPGQSCAPDTECSISFWMLQASRAKTRGPWLSARICWRLFTAAISSSSVSSTFQAKTATIKQVMCNCANSTRQRDMDVESTVATRSRRSNWRWCHSRPSMEKRRCPGRRCTELPKGDERDLQRADEAQATPKCARWEMKATQTNRSEAVRNRVARRCRRGRRHA